MRKGLAITLGVVALILVVSPGFAVAPVISCVPDIVVSDIEQNAQTNDVNFFIFSNALDLDEYVTDTDTTAPALRWCFIETPGRTISLNGIVSNASVNLVEPGASDLRVVSRYLTVQNVLWSSPALGPTWSDPAPTSMTSTLSLYVSDGTNTDTLDLIIRTVNKKTQDYNVGTPDGRVLPTLASWTFPADVQGWGWFGSDVPGVIVMPAHQWLGGALTMTESTPHTTIVFGGYESPQNPAVGVHQKPGCVARARYLMTSSVETAATPGFRLRAITYHMEQVGGVWQPAFGNLDRFGDFQVYFSTFDIFHIAGRMPGAAPGKTYTVLSYPPQTSTLDDSDVVTYFTVDLCDLQGMLHSDAGTLSVDQVDVDGFDSPAIGAGTAVPEMSFTSFTSWSTKGVNALDPTLGNITGLTVTESASNVTIHVAAGNAWYDAYAEPTAGAALTAGTYYRTSFFITSTETDTGPRGPTVRASIVSTQFVWSCDKQIDGGTLYARFGSVAKPFTIWYQAPSELASTPGLTEPVKPRIESWLIYNRATDWPFYRAVEGNIALTRVQTESFSTP